jgi:hypothetical protein
MKKGYIYKLTNNNDPNDFYIGSTWNMEERMKQHRARCKNETNPDYNNHLYKCIREKGNIDEWIFNVIEENLFENNMTRFQREQHHMNILKPTINFCKAYRSWKESIQYSKEYSKIYDKIRYDTKITCICGSITNKIHKARHEKTKKHIKFITQQQP